MTEGQVLLGLGLIVVPAVGSQVLTSRPHIPALIVLLPVGFTAGALTDDVNPERLLGSTFSPLVSPAVALILYDAGLGLDLRRFTAHTRRVVVRLIWFGVLLTGISAALVAMPLLGMSQRAAVMLGAILVVSGPTVVGPLLAFVRPTERLQRILIWEGSLIDPVGGILGALVFHGVEAGERSGFGSKIGQFAVSTTVRVAGGARRSGRTDDGSAQSPPRGGARHRGAARRGGRCGGRLRRRPGRRGTHRRRPDGVGGGEPARLGRHRRKAVLRDPRESGHRTAVHLHLGHRQPPVPAACAAALPGTRGSPRARDPAACGGRVSAGDRPTAGERGLFGWMAPRGIVAAATASTFSATLVAKGIGGAEKILPATFVVIVATVALYGLSAAPVARRLGVVRSARSRPLLVGVDPWVVDLGRALRSAGLDVVMWAGREAERDSISAAGIELAPGELFVAATGAGAELEGLTGVLLLTGEDDFNALAAANLEGTVEGTVHRLRPAAESRGVIAPYAGDQVLFEPELTGAELARRYSRGPVS